MGSFFAPRNLPLAAFTLTVGVSATSAGLPVVDLGYTKHQALSYNVGSPASDQTKNPTDSNHRKPQMPTV
jgi:hypothetical protein